MGSFFPSPMDMGSRDGSHEGGLVLGNEAVWTNQPYQSAGLLGMDLVRLGLERGETTSAAACLGTPSG